MALARSTQQEPMLRVECEMTDCLCYNTGKNDGEVFCSHAEKKFHKGQKPCPLYRMDWTKKASMFDDY